MTDLDRCPTCKAHDRRVVSAHCRDAWHLEETIPIRLMIAADWDEGFQLAPAARPLDDVAPGGDCLAECVVPRSIVIREVLVNDFQLTGLSVGTRAATISNSVALFGWQRRLYRLDPPLTARAGEYVLARLHNGRAVTHKPKVATLVALRDGDDLPPTCPSCSSNDPRLRLAPKKSAQSALRYYGDDPRQASPPPECRDMWHTRALGDGTKPREWIIEDAQAVHVVEPPSSGRADPERRQMPSPRDGGCPTCRSPVAELRHRLEGDTWCQDAWHDRASKMHAPHSIVRTLHDGPGNETTVHGCSCGADVEGAEAFAKHVGWPAAAVRALLDLTGIAYDLLDYPAEMSREDVTRAVARCLEVRSC